MKHAIVLVATLAAACVRTAPAPAPTPVGERPVPVEGTVPDPGGLTPTTDAAVPFMWSVEPERYALVTETTVIPDSTTAPLPAGALSAETFSRTAYVSYRYDPGTTPSRVTGTVDSFAIAGGTRVASTIATQLTNVPFEASLDGTRVIAFGSPMSNASCALPVGALLDAARDLVVALPPRLAAGMEWLDTTTTVGCRGELSITTTSRHRWLVERIDSAAGTLTAHVVRRAETMIAGSGMQRGSSVTLSGAGTGELRYVFDIGEGHIARAEGGSETRLIFEAEGQRREFVQRVRHRWEHTPAP